MCWQKPQNPKLKTMCGDWSRDKLEITNVCINGENLAHILETREQTCSLAIDQAATMEMSFMSFLRSLITAYVLALLLGPAPASAANADTSKVSFYFAAHEDDWQLFMNPAAFDDVSGAAGKTVFIHVTAGDDGLGAGSGGRKHP